MIRRRHTGRPIKQQDDHENRDYGVGHTSFFGRAAQNMTTVPRSLRSGLTLLVDISGPGEVIRRQHNYLIRLRLWLNRGEPVRWHMAWGPVGTARLEDNGETLITEVRIDRRSLVNGLFYGVDGMRVGGTRRLEIAPHLGYGDRGVPGVIPAAAVLTRSEERRVGKGCRSGWRREE